MKITFSILWFDDNEDYLDSLDLDVLKEKIESWGFRPNIITVNTPKEFLAHEPFHEFDLIAMDYNLEEFDKHGEEFIKRVRQHDVYTEVVFYSANQVSDLWDAIREKELEGVFVASRSGGGEITKIINVAEQSVKQFLDLNNIRGLIMAEVGNIDGQLEKIAVNFFNDLEYTSQIKIVNKYIDRISKQANNAIQQAETLRDTNNISELMTLLDSAKKWNLCKSISKVSQIRSLDKFDNYQAEILKPRNFMAHGIPIELDNGSLKFIHCGNDFIFDDNESISIRRKLQFYSIGFDNILSEMEV